jgi:hypothetical protein
MGGFLLRHGHQQSRRYVSHIDESSSRVLSHLAVKGFASSHLIPDRGGKIND